MDPLGWDLMVLQYLSQQIAMCYDDNYSPASFLAATWEPEQLVKSKQNLASVISRVVELLNLYGLLNSKSSLDFAVLNTHALGFKARQVHGHMGSLPRGTTTPCGPGPSYYRGFKITLRHHNC